MDSIALLTIVTITLGRQNPIVAYLAVVCSFSFLYSIPLYLYTIYFIVELFPIFENYRLPVTHVDV